MEALRRFGGRHRFGAKVENLVEHATAIGVQLADAEVIASDWVIFAADGDAYGILGVKYTDKYVEKIYRKLSPFRRGVE